MGFILMYALVAAGIAAAAYQYNSDSRRRDLVHQGREALSDGRYKVSERAYRRLVKSGKVCYEQELAYEGLGRALERMDRVSEAADVYARYLERYAATGRGQRDVIRSVRYRLEELRLSMPHRVRTDYRLPEGPEIRVAPSLEQRIRVHEDLSTDAPVIRVRESEPAPAIRASLVEPAERPAAGEQGSTLERVDESELQGQVRRLIGRYLVSDKIGEGGLGEVYQAYLPVALKVAKNPELVDNLRRLGTLQSKVKSSRIVMPLEVNLESDPPYVVMEYVDGPDMRALLRHGDRSGRARLPVTEALGVMLEVTRGLKDAHDVGVLHLDLKPENVLLTRAGAVKLTDFELGRDQEEAAHMRLEQSLVSIDEDSLKGTVAYMSPEQRFSKKLDERSDIYTVGVMLFEALTGELPQPGDKPSDFIEGLPEEVDRAFGRCFTRYERRYERVDELVEELESALARCAERPDIAGLLRALGEPRASLVTEGPLELEPLPEAGLEAVTSAESRALEAGNTVSSPAVVLARSEQPVGAEAPDPEVRAAEVREPEVSVAEAPEPEISVAEPRPVAAEEAAAPPPPSRPARRPSLDELIAESASGASEAPARPSLDMVPPADAPLTEAPGVAPEVAARLDAARGSGSEAQLEAN